MKTYPHEIAWYKKQQQATEIMQYILIRYSFLSDNNEECSYLVKCRDFLHDIVKARLTNERISIYNYQYDGENDPQISLKQTKMIIDVPVTFKERVEKAATQSLSLLHYYEKTYKFSSKTEVFAVKDTEKLVYISPIEWQSAPQLISFYSLLIRISFREVDIKIKTEKDLDKYYDEITKKELSRNDHDVSYVKKIRKVLPLVFSNRKELFELNKEGFSSQYFEKNVPISHFHNYYGIVTLCNIDSYKNKTTSLMPVQKKLLELYNKQKKNGEEKVTLEKRRNDKPLIHIHEKDTNLKKNAQAENNDLCTSAISFALVVKDGEDRFLLNSFVSCRDYLNDILLSAVRGGKSTRLGGQISSGRYLPDWDKMRLLIKTGTFGSNKGSKDNRKRIFFAKKVINILEEFAKFSSTSKISTVYLNYNGNETDYSKQDSNKIIFLLLTGPKEWMKYSQTLSIVTYIIKAIIVSQIPLKKIPEQMDTIDDVINFFNNTLTNYSSVNNTYCNTFAKLFATHIKIILENFNKIFTQERKDAFPHNESYFHNIGGIVSLMRKQTGANKQLAKNLEQVYTKIEKPKS